jgi:predicted aldo/keto reductase-like oxidoreductase
MSQLQAFFMTHGEMVRLSSSSKVLDLCRSSACPSGPHKISGPLEEYALRWLLEVQGVTSVLLGMTQTDYVETAVRSMKMSTRGTHA